MATLALRRATLSLAVLFLAANAQVLSLQNVSMPLSQPYSMVVLYTYYVYSHSDSPEKFLPDEPYVKMNLRTNLPGSIANPDCNPDSLYRGVQLSIFPQQQVWKLIDPKRFCDVQTEKFVLKNGRPAWFDHSYDVDGNAWWGYTYDVDGTRGPRVPLPWTGAFYLVLSNCGPCLHQTVTGEVVVKNAHGYLPANEYYKASFYKWLAALFAIAIPVWVVQLRIWRTRIHPIHLWLTFVLVCALVEALAWLMLLTTWNVTGGFAPWMLCSANLASVLKTGICYTLVYCIVRGWGITKESMDDTVKTKAGVFVCFYAPMQYIFEGISAYRHTQHVPKPMMLMGWFPSAAMNCLVLFFIFRGLVGTLATARRSQQPGLLTLLHRLGKTMTLMAVITVVAHVFKILDISRNEPPASWHGQWLLAEGVQDALFVVTVSLKMFILSPCRNMKEYLYTDSLPTIEQDVNVIGAAAPDMADKSEDGIGVLHGEKGDEHALSKMQRMTHPESRGPDCGTRRGTTGTADGDLRG